MGLLNPANNATQAEPGLLDQVFSTPSSQALWALGSGLLGVRRGNEGAAFQNAMHSYNEAQQEQRRNKLTDAELETRRLQMQQLMQQQTDAQDVRSFWSNPANYTNAAKPAVPYGAGMTGGLDMQDVNPGSPASPAGPMGMRQLGQSMIASGKPALVQQGLTTIQKTPPLHVKAGESIIEQDANGAYKPVFTAPDHTTQPELQKIVALRDSQLPGSPSYRLYDDMVKKLTTHAPAPSAVVNLTQEKAEAGTVGKFFGDMYSKIQEGGFSAPSKIAKLDRFAALTKGIDTGRATPTQTEIAAYAKSFGIDIDPNLDAKQAANALSKEMALQLRNPAGGAGMPGALSDQDRRFLEQMVPSLANTPGGNGLILETARRLAKREADIAKMAREYRGKKGQMDEGFFNSLAAYSEANPLFGDLAQQAGAAAPASSGGARYIGPAK